MFKVKSLKYVIGLQFAVVVLPIAGVLVYQSISDSRNAASAGFELASVMIGVSLLSAAGFLFLLIKGLAEPLDRAVSLAGSIAEGDFREDKPIHIGRDVGGLLASLVAMRDRLSRAFHDLERNDVRLANAQRIAGIGDWETNLVTGKTTVSDMVFPIVGRSRGKFSWASGIPIHIVYPEDRLLVQTSLHAAQFEGKDFSIDFRVVLPSGESRFVHSQMEVARDKTGKPVTLCGTIQDITLRKKAEKQIEYLALHDGLTGLPNRRLFRDETIKIIAMCERLGQKAAVLYFDLDRFKNVNDSLGHHVGDALLIEVTARISRVLRRSDFMVHGPMDEPDSIMARLGGDEFTVLLSNLQHTDDAARVAQRILDSLAVPFVFEAKELYVSASIGIALFPMDGKDATLLVQNADAAMYHAKDEGRNNYQFFTASMNKEAAVRLALENDLRKALSLGQLILHYQPQVDIETRKIFGVEALIRWQHPEKGLVPPSEFIPLAEERGLIVQIGEWVLRTACAQANAWHQAGLEKVVIAINMASPSFRQLNLLEIVRAALADSGLEPKYLELEVTESVIMHHLDVVMPMLTNLKRIGIHLSIDDFGTGYSSLSYLNKFPINALKIDRSFVSNIDKSEGSEIVKAIIALANSLKLDLIAEGVETEAQAKFLQDSGCNNMQGFLFSKPLTADGITRLLEQQLS